MLWRAADGGDAHLAYFLDLAATSPRGVTRLQVNPNPDPDPNPNPTPNQVNLALVRPRVPTLVLSAGCGRYDGSATPNLNPNPNPNPNPNLNPNPNPRYDGSAAPLVPEGDVLLLQPAHTLVERGARAVDFGRGAARFAEVSPHLSP